MKGIGSTSMCRTASHKLCVFNCFVWQHFTVESLNKTCWKKSWSPNQIQL